MALLYLKKLVLPSHDSGLRRRSSHDTELGQPFLSTQNGSASSSSSTTTSARSSSEHNHSEKPSPPSPSSPFSTPSPKTSWSISPRTLSDATLGLSDGLTVPFALTAGLSALHPTTRIVIFGGLAELTAGAISMGLGGYLGARSEIYSYGNVVARTRRLVESSSESGREMVGKMVKEALGGFGFGEGVLRDVGREVEGMEGEVQVSFLMKFYYQMAPPGTTHAYRTAFTIALAYFLGGFLPLVPYLLVAEDDVAAGLRWSCLVMACALFAFGYVKTWLLGDDEVVAEEDERGEGGTSRWQCVKGGLQMMVLGAVAAGAAMGLVRAFE